MYVFLYMRAYNIQAYSTGGEKGGCVLQGDKGMQENVMGDVDTPVSQKYTHAKFASP